MPVTIVDSTTGTTTATLPAGTVSGDIVVVFAYRSASATAPTLPASWTSILTVAVSPSIRLAYRVYDGVWTMPTFTNATRCHAVTLRGQHVTTPIGITGSASATNQTITWAAMTLQDTTGASAVLRGAIHARPDVVIPASTGHTSREAEGTQPGQITQSKNDTTNAAVATSATSRSDLYSVAQVEIKSAPVIPPQRPITIVRQAVNRAGVY